ncbi:MAG TPA: hypothetical protein VF968_03015 [Actinomycetota bacterium]
MAEEQVHDWAAARLYHLTPSEAALVAALPQFLEEVGSAAAVETVGPFCSDCGATWDSTGSEPARFTTLRSRN